MGGESGSCVCTGHQCHCRSSSRAQLLQRVPMGSWGCPCCATKAPARAPLGLQEVSPAPGGLPRAGIPHGSSKRQSSPGRAAQRTPKERVLFTSLALCVGRMVRVVFFLHFCCHFLGLGSSQVAQAGAEHSWHRAGHAASPASQEFGSQRQELSHVLHVPGICPPALLDPRELTQPCCS